MGMATGTRTATTAVQRTGRSTRPGRAGAERPRRTPTGTGPPTASTSVPCTRTTSSVAPAAAAGWAPYGIRTRTRSRTASTGAPTAPTMATGPASAAAGCRTRTATGTESSTAWTPAQTTRARSTRACVAAACPTRTRTGTACPTADERPRADSKRLWWARQSDGTAIHRRSWGGASDMPSSLAQRSVQVRTPGRLSPVEWRGRQDR